MTEWKSRLESGLAKRSAQRFDDEYMKPTGIQDNIEKQVIAVSLVRRYPLGVIQPLPAPPETGIECEADR